MMLLEAVVVLALSPATRSWIGTWYLAATLSTTGLLTRTSSKVTAYCAAALVEKPLAVTAGTMTVALAWYLDGCISSRPPVIRPARSGTTMGSQSQRRIARR